MNVLKISPRGYCQGVIKALNLVKQALITYKDQPIYLLGMIVHNQLITQALIKKGVILLDETKSKEEWIEGLDTGVIIVSAHGISPQLLNKIKAKGLIVVDATCEYVSLAQQLVTKYLNNDYDIIFIGQKDHPEAQGICGINPKSIHLITSEADIDSLALANKNLLLTTQTTMNHKSVEKLFQILKLKYPNIIIADEICDATRKRQEALLKLNETTDLVYVVGDINSNNANKLVEIAKNQTKQKVFLIQSVVDIKEEDLINVKEVAITSAASTPTILTQQVIEYLENYPTIKKDLILDEIL